MVQIHQLFVGNSLRNFTYIIEYGNNNAICIDPTEASLVDEELKKKGLLLKGIINTHEHFDHTAGNKKLVEEYHCDVYVHYKAKSIVAKATKALDEGDKIPLDDSSYLYVLSTPGHTYGHVCLVLYESRRPEALFSGDTLFNAGVGNCKGGGDVESLYESITHKLKTLPENLKLYPGHEYIKNNVTFAKTIERGNKELDSFYNKYLEELDKGQWLVSTLEEEFRINPFFRLDSNEVKQYLEAMRMNCGTQQERFVSLRSLRDNW